MNESETKKAVLPLPDGTWIAEDGSIVQSEYVEDELKKTVREVRSRTVPDWIDRNIETLRAQSDEDFISWLRQAASKGTTLPYNAPFDTSPTQILESTSTRIQRQGEAMLAAKMESCICQAIGSWQPAFGLRPLAELAKFAFFSDIQSAVRYLKGRLDRFFEVIQPKSKDDMLTLDSIISALASFARESDLASEICQDLLSKPGYEPFAGLLFPAAIASSQFDKKDWPTQAMAMLHAFRNGPTGYSLPAEYHGFHLIDSEGVRERDPIGVFSLYGPMEELCSRLSFLCIAEGLPKLWDIGGEKLIYVFLAGTDPILDFSWDRDNALLKIRTARRLAIKRPVLSGYEAIICIDDTKHKEFWNFLFSVKEKQVPNVQSVWEAISKVLDGAINTNELVVDKGI